MINQALAAILACPACKGKVFLDKETVACDNCGLIYPIKEGIPIMLIEEAKKNENK